MRDDAEYWQALSARIVSRIRDEREMRLGWPVWTVPLAVAAGLMLLISRSGPAPVVERTPSIAAMLTPGGQTTPSIVRLLGARR